MLQWKHKTPEFLTASRKKNPELRALATMSGATHPGCQSQMKVSTKLHCWW